MGLVVFSKYPIIHEEGEQFENSANGYLLTDIVKDQDTIRVINLQLWSMGIRVNKMTSKIRLQDYTDAKKKAVASSPLFARALLSTKRRWTKSIASSKKAPIPS